MLIDSILDGDDKFKVDPRKLKRVLDSYDEDIHKAEDDLTTKGKNLEKLNRENASFQHYYESARVELSSLAKSIERLIDRRKSILFQHYTENLHRDLSDKAKERYMEQDQEYLALYDAYLRVRERHDILASVVEAFKSRGFQLRNITELRIAQLHDIVL